ASCCCPSQARIKGTLRCARAPSSALRAPSPVNGRRASSPSLAARVGISPSPAKREKGFLPNSRRKVRDQPFSCAADEGGAQRRMRARAKRAAVVLPRQGSKARFAALAPPHPPSGHLLP